VAIVTGQPLTAILELDMDYLSALEDAWADYAEAFRE